MEKKILIPIVFFILTSCGFSPIYNASEKVNYNINFIEKNGDNTINNKIISEILRLTDKDSKNIFDIDLITNYSKSIISKDAKGSATNYEIIVEAQFNIKFEDKVKVVNVNEKQNIKKISDMFEQRNYENTLKKNFAISIANKLNLELLSIKWF